MKVQVNKFDAIRAQLDAAIELYFVSDNIVATHTLAAAAYNTLKDLARREGSEHPFLKAGYLESLPESERQRTIKYLNEAENFFKHADRDPDATLSFDLELTQLLLMDACAYFKDSREPKAKYYDVFKAWVGRVKEDLPEGSTERQFVENLRAAFKAKGKQQFWEIFRKHLTSRSTRTA